MSRCVASQSAKSGPVSIVQEVWVYWPRRLRIRQWVVVPQKDKEHVWPAFDLLEAYYDDRGEIVAPEAP